MKIRPARQMTEDRVVIAATDAPTRTGLHDQRAVRLLVLTSLYPNAEQPHHGVFVEERLRKLVATGRVMATVVAPVPWFPFRSARFGRYTSFARVPRQEERYGIEILHPRYPVIPKVGMNLAPMLMYRALLPVMRKMVTNAADFDLIDAHYFYPDGVVAARLGVTLRMPVVISARGSDVTWIPRHRHPRRKIQRAARQATAIITVSQSLKDCVVKLGGDPEKVSALRNGVDLERFRPLPERLEIRAALGLAGPVWLVVGHLVEHKGTHITLAALADVPDATLLIAGDGPEECALRHQAERSGIADRVRFLGPVPHDDLCRYYNAADVMVLASSREGMPNVVLESLACGTPVVATAVNGTPELITSSEAGELMHERSSAALLAAWMKLRSRLPERSATRAFAEGLGWAQVVETQCRLYAQAAAGQRPFEAAGVPR